MTLIPTPFLEESRKFARGTRPATYHFQNAYHIRVPLHQRDIFPFTSLLYRLYLNRRIAPAWDTPFAGYQSYRVTLHP